MPLVSAVACSFLFMTLETNHSNFDRSVNLCNATLVRKKVFGQHHSYIAPQKMCKEKVKFKLNIPDTVVGVKLPGSKAC